MINRFILLHKYTPFTTLYGYIIYGGSRAKYSVVEICILLFALFYDFFFKWNGSLSLSLSRNGHAFFLFNTRF
jgi:hypothetical protein